ncbi:golvesin C-terminal-like domain-containing protein, partial [Streptosporangium sp. OZ121]|uniref:golvesin C-terminal-like domain-containing protein n=1 Tax=Streptosporangium sp. OZ121 TaxID=3444183 RepID=UPI003F794C0E
GAPTTHPATTPAALAYRAAYNVKDLTLGLGLGDLDIDLVADGVVSNYNPITRTISLEFAEAGTSTAEHEIGHAFMHDVYGADFIKFADPSCLNSHFFGRPSAPKCALLEGFAHWISVTAENGHGSSARPYRYGLEVWQNIENCTFSGTEDILRCDDGPQVEGRVAGVLWDMYDLSPSEAHDGFADRSVYSFATIIDTFRRKTPATFAQFWTAWLQRLGDQDKKRDQESAFLNTLAYTAVIDAKHADVITGNWSGVLCGDCVGSNLLRSWHLTGENAPELAWKLDGAAVPQRGMYDIWVRLPSGKPSFDRRATYKINTAFGDETAIVDQVAATDGWTNLGKYGFDLDPTHPIRVRLTNAIATPDDPTLENLVADAIVIAPHQD